MLLADLLQVVRGRPADIHTPSPQADTANLRMLHDTGACHKPRRPLRNFTRTPPPCSLPCRTPSRPALLVLSNLCMVTLPNVPNLIEVTLQGSKQLLGLSTGSHHTTTT